MGHDFTAVVNRHKILWHRIRALGSDHPSSPKSCALVDVFLAGFTERSGGNLETVVQGNNMRHDVRAFQYAIALHLATGFSAQRLLFPLLYGGGVGNVGEGLGAFVAALADPRGSTNVSSERFWGCRCRCGGVNRVALQQGRVDGATVAFNERLLDAWIIRILGNITGWRLTTPFPTRIQE